MQLKVISASPYLLVSEFSNRYDMTNNFSASFHLKREVKKSMHMMGITFAVKDCLVCKEDINRNIVYAMNIPSKFIIKENL